jgi:hypothetical protein
MNQIFSLFSCRWWLVSFWWVFVSCLLTVSAYSPAAAATRMLLINQTRVIFSETTRAMEVHVGNVGKEPIAYTIDLVSMRRDKDGNLREVKQESEEERLVKEMIRFAPRRATIEPGKRQVVKLMLRKPGDLPPGEYQTRLRFTPQASTPEALAAPKGGPEGKTSIQLNVLVASTIPIIIQHGITGGEAAPVALAVKSHGQKGAELAAEVQFTRSGIGSVFGDATVSLLPAGASHKAQVIGQATGIALYAPDKEHSVLIPLKGINRAVLAGGKLRVAFRPQSGVKGARERQAAERTLEVPVR